MVTKLSEKYLTDQEGNKIAVVLDDEWLDNKKADLIKNITKRES